MKRTKDKSLRLSGSVAVGALALAVAFGADAEAKTVLKVYTALEEEHMPISKIRTPASIRAV